MKKQKRFSVSLWKKHDSIIPRKKLNCFRPTKINVSMMHRPKPMFIMKRKFIGDGKFGTPDDMINYIQEGKGIVVQPQMQELKSKKPRNLKEPSFSKRLYLRSKKIYSKFPVQEVLDRGLEPKEELRKRLRKEKLKRIGKHLPESIEPVSSLFKSEKLKQPVWERQEEDTENLIETIKREKKYGTLPKGEIKMSYEEAEEFMKNVKHKNPEDYSSYEYNPTPEDILYGKKETYHGSAQDLLDGDGRSLLMVEDLGDGRIRIRRGKR
ncbi:hypothetical protein M0R04_08935 [Candidatus Dojkabacteria bacterium]|nr:hypothetical protein [Candidatus Dojkabacteria bacterium]